MAGTYKGHFKYTLKGRVSSNVTVLSVSVPRQFNKDLNLYGRVHSIVLKNFGNIVLPTTHEVWIQADLFNRAVITATEERPRFLKKIRFKSHCNFKRRICRKFKTCVCSPNKKLICKKGGYQKVIRKSFSTVSIIIYTNRIAAFDIQVTLKFSQSSNLN
jgi:hypothetical protein